MWKQRWVPFIQNVIDACLVQLEAGVLGNVYAIGGNNVNHITEAHRLSDQYEGEIRAEVDRIILDSVANKNLQAIIARAPDFFGELPG